MSGVRSPSGQLYVVATPIGHLGDVSARAREVLAQVDSVAAEDTRRTGQLLAHLGIKKPLLSLHEHNEARRIDVLIEQIAAGASIALVSDAGTPLISDPGFELVRAAIERGVAIVPIPGPCAAIVALSAAGLPTDRFAFEGFLPAKSGARRERLGALRKEQRTLIFYEAPHRLVATLHDIAAELGEARRAVVARELTKQFECFYRGTASELARQAERDSDMRRGEIVIVVSGASVESAETSYDAEQVLRVLLDELAPAQAAKLAAKLTGATRSSMYELALKLNARNGR